MAEEKRGQRYRRKRNEEMKRMTRIQKRSRQKKNARRNYQCGEIRIPNRGTYANGERTVRAKRHSRKRQICGESKKRPNDKTICDPDELNKIYGELYDEEVTHRALEIMGSDEDCYLGTVIQYIDQYLYHLTEAIPERNEDVWAAFHGHPKEFFTATKYETHQGA